MIQDVAQSFGHLHAYEDYSLTSNILVLSFVDEP